MQTSTPDTSPRAPRWTMGALTAVGVGLGAALATAMGPAGWAVGLAVPASVGGIRALRRR